MKTKHNSRSVFPRFLITSLSLFILFFFLVPQERVKGQVSEGQTELVGYLGPQYKLSAHDFRISLEKVKHMNLLHLSKASVHDVVDQKTSTEGIEVIKNNVEESPGVYLVEFGLTQDEDVRKEINVTVYEGSESSSDVSGPGTGQSGSTDKDVTSGAGSGKDSDLGKWLPLTGESSVVYGGYGLIILIVLFLLMRLRRKK